MNNKRIKKTLPKKESAKKNLIKVVIPIIFVLLVVLVYLIMVFGNIPFVLKWRNIWIETAMTTDEHKWLATSFFPEDLISEVMSKQVNVKDVGKTEITADKAEDILGQKNLDVGKTDSHGNKVIVNDLEQGIVVLKIEKQEFVGRLVLIDNPSRVYLSTTDYKDSRGEVLCDYLNKEDAILAVNASGFRAVKGVETGGAVAGMCMSQGECWGKYSSKYITVGFDENDHLVVGEFSDWDDYKLRDAIQYHPALIVNGEKVIEGSSGWGLQPRTVIGQAANGVVMFFVVDGRQIGYSLGATMGDCADVLEEYGAVNAGACDGGSSATLAYNGKIINKPSLAMENGAQLPNAWVVVKK